MLETLEKKLSAAAGTQWLVAVVPDGRLAAADVVVGGAKLLDRRPSRARGCEHLAETVAAEIAVKVSSKGHLVRNLQGRKRSSTMLFFNQVDRPVMFPFLL